MSRPTFMWPLYFARKALKAPRLTLEAGQIFPLQDKNYIRGLAAIYGLKGADQMGFADLPYVEVLNVHSEEFARQVREQGLRYGQAKKLVDAPVGEAV